MTRMPTSLKIFLYAMGGAAVAVAIATLAVRVFVDANSFRPQVEAAASRALGMDVKVEGALHVAFIPRLHLSLEKVRVRNKGTEILFAEAAGLTVAFAPLLERELRYEAVTLEGARVTIVRDRDGHYNYEKAVSTAGKFPALTLQRLSFPQLTVVYVDKKSATGFEASKCEGDLTNLSHPGNAPFLARLSASGQFTCDEVRGKLRAISDLKFSLEATRGVYVFAPVTMSLARGRGTGSLRMDRSGLEPILQLRYTVAKFRIEDVLNWLPADKSVSGPMDFSTTLTLRGRTRSELRKSAAGEASLSGANLTLTGVDLDKAFSSYASTQNFSLFDVGAVLLAGPLGLLVTKGYDVAGLAAQTGGSTQIQTVVSKWKVEKGVANAQDAALSTGKHRLALQGGLDFVDDEYDEVYLAVVDANGCALVRERIRGPFSKPIVEKPSVLTSVTGSVVNLFGKAAELLPGKDPKCQVFYRGSVAAPK